MDRKPEPKGEVIERIGIVLTLEKEEMEGMYDLVARSKNCINCIG